MAKKKAGINKSQLIRDHIAANPEDGAKAIIAALKKTGVKVSESLVGAVKYKKKGKKKRRGKKAAAVAKPVASDKVSLSTLVKAKKLSDELGGIEKAKAALAALAKLV
jgi:hypothetical protein